MRCALWGDGPWAAKVLGDLIDRGHAVAGVVLRHESTTPVLRDAARARDIDVIQPRDANAEDVRRWVAEKRADLSISIKYDQIIRRPLLAATPLGFINVHPGKLPWYRGRSTVNWAIVNGESEVGITVHVMDEGVDTGDILLQETVPIEWADTYASMLAKLQEVVPPLVVKAVDGLADRSLVPRPQIGFGSYFSVRRAGDESIDWGESSLQIYNLIRAVSPPGPCARTQLDGRGLLVRSARYERDWPCYRSVPGEVVGRESDGVRVKTGDSTIVLTSFFYADDPAAAAAALPVGVRLTRLP
jgi:methionyl-tRNA formyltransferase